MGAALSSIPLSLSQQAGMHAGWAGGLFSSLRGSRLRERDRQKLDPGDRTSVQEG